MSQTLTFQSGEVGKTLSDVPGQTLTGYTAKLIVQDPLGNTNTYTMTVQGDNQTVQYTTLGTEFVTPGTHKIQIELTNASDKFYTPIGIVRVLGNLA